ncbi:MAG: c-type cytochrome [Burkholderiaceae bacterium]
MENIVSWLRVILLGSVAFCASAYAAAQQIIPDTIAQRVVACAGCHGKEGRATSEGFFPRIAGKPAGYLYNQLVNFREGRRQYPMMTYMVDHLSDDYLREIANYFSNQHLAYPPPQTMNVPQAQLERGRQLVMNGDPSHDLPACMACHGKKLTGVVPAIPGLLGLPHDYLNAQFGAWRNGTRRAAAPDCMASLAKRMSADDINAATSWLASQNLTDDSAPATSLPATLPIQCGSVVR